MAIKHAIFHLNSAKRWFKINFEALSQEPPCLQITQKGSQQHCNNNYQSELPSRPSNVQLTPWGISSLFPPKVWWGLVKNSLACGPYNLWKSPTTAHGWTLEAIVWTSGQKSVAKVSVVHLEEQISTSTLTLSMDIPCLEKADTGGKTKLISVRGQGAIHNFGEGHTNV